MNENYPHPALPQGAEDGILRGMYLLKEAKGAQAQLLGSGTILREALAAAELLEKDWGVAANVWSVTSFTELRRSALGIERHNRLSAGKGGKTYVERCFEGTAGPVIAASDYVRAVPDLIRPWVPRHYVALGTDGYGRSDTRAALRDYFEVSRTHIAIAALRALADEGAVKPSVVAEAIARYGVKTDTPHPWDA
jgi:pyruvate dehydrogenase E1 component